MKSGSLDYWREYFRTANSDIFEIIDWAIVVAASDCPKEFRSRRDRIAERLFSSRLTRCSGCNRVELAVPENDEAGNTINDNSNNNRDGGGDDDGDDDDDEEIDIGNGYEFDSGGVASTKESKVNNNNSSSNNTNGEMNVNESDQLVSNYSFGEAEALTDEIEEESQTVREVLRIKDLLFNCQDESDSVLFDSLKKLQWMALSVDTLKATEIGKAVNGLRKHGSKKIRHLARTLIDEWKVLVDEWYNATKNMKGDEGTPESVNPSVLDEEEGLPSPPLDVDFFATQPTGMELSQFFDGMDDDGNPRNGGEFIRNREPERKPSLERHSVTKQNKQTPSNGTNVLAKDKNQQVKRQEAVVKPSRASNTNSGPGRPPKHNVEQIANNNLKLQHRADKVTGQIKPSVQKNKLKPSDEISVQMKLEATKRKLQESYQQAENAKRQRTIQVMELHDLPKQGLGHKNSQMRPGNHNRHWAHGRR